MIEFKIRNTAIRGFRRLSKNVIPAAALSMKTTAEWVRGYVVKHKLAGQVLHKRTGRLAGSVESDVSVGVNQVRGMVGSNLVYARIHELGGVIRAKNFTYLHFKVGGKWVKTKSVKMPKRSYLASTINQKRNEIVRRYGKSFYSNLGRLP